MTGGTGQNRNTGHNLLPNCYQNVARVFGAESWGSTPNVFRYDSRDARCPVARACDHRFNRANNVSLYLGHAIRLKVVFSIPLNSVVRIPEGLRDGSQAVVRGLYAGVATCLSFCESGLQVVIAFRGHRRGLYRAESSSVDLAKSSGRTSITPSNSDGRRPILSL